MPALGGDDEVEEATVGGDGGARGLLEPRPWT